jgi:hypothetical protein
MENLDIYFKAILVRPFGIFLSPFCAFDRHCEHIFPYWHVTPRKIWQPCVGVALEIGLIFFIWLCMYTQAVQSSMFGT